MPEYLSDGCLCRVRYPNGEASAAPISRNELQYTVFQLFGCLLQPGIQKCEKNKKCRFV